MVQKDGVLRGSKSQSWGTWEATLPVGGGPEARLALSAQACLAYPSELPVEDRELCLSSGVLEATEPSLSPWASKTQRVFLLLHSCSLPSFSTILAAFPSSSGLKSEHSQAWLWPWGCHSITLRTLNYIGTQP